MTGVTSVGSYWNYAQETSVSVEDYVAEEEAPAEEEPEPVVEEEAPVEEEPV